MRSIWQRYWRFRPFSETEAWGLFRLAAIGEAVGWTLLITGIVISRWVTPGNNIAVDIAGQFHGTLFLIYLAAVFAVSPSLRWRLPRLMLAGLVSVPPYGTLVFELAVGHSRQYRAFTALRNSLCYHAAVQGS